MSETPPVRVGIVGLGNIGRYHADHLFDLGADVVGGMDIDPDARTAFAEDYGTAVYEDETELYEVADAVVVTTPNKFHEEYAISALEAGVDVLLEKPLANTLESAKRIAEAAEAADPFCMVGFNNRFARPIEVVKGYQDDGRFGETRHVEANYVRRRGIPGRGSWFTSKAVSGGGALIDIGVHAIDLSLHLLDFPEVVEVSGVTRSEFGGREDYSFVEMWGEDVGAEGFDVDDSATALIRCADGKTISLEVAWAVNRPNTQDFYVRGTHAGAHFDMGSGDLELYETNDVGGDHLSDSTIETRSEDTHRREQATFLEAVRAGEAPERNTVEQGLAVQRVIEAIYESSETGEAVRLE